jgi:O-antigen ligase
MNERAVSLPAVLHQDRHRTAIFRAPAFLLALLLGIAYGGGVILLRGIAPWLHIAYYSAVLLLTVNALVQRPRAATSAWANGLYACWIVFYCVWGALVASDAASILPDALRTIGQNLLFLTAVAVSIDTRRDLDRLVNIAQCVAILNLGLAVYQVSHPEFIGDLVRALCPDLRGFTYSRPAGLWFNPNLAALGWLFSLLLSRWGNRMLARIAQIAAVWGIYLSASRSGIYVLLLCAVLYLLLRNRAESRTRRRLASVASGLAITAAITGAVYFCSTLTAPDVSESYSIQRALDYREEAASRYRQVTRLELAEAALQVAMDTPWTGLGLFSLYGRTDSIMLGGTDLGAHNIYLTVWGETGVVGAVPYLLLLGLAIRRTLRSPIMPLERVPLILMWITYLVFGLVWHNQLTSVHGMIYIALLNCLPRTLMAGPAVPQPTRADAATEPRPDGRLASRSGAAFQS